MTSEEKFIDLHIHSNCSDGAYAPVEIVERAATVGLSAIALADHDSVSGIDLALTAAQKHGIELIPAIELSVKYQQWKDVHLLGYGIDYTNPAFTASLDEFRQRRKNRNAEILEKINAKLAIEAKEPISVEEVLAYAADTIGRPHIARAMLKRGYVNNIEDAFQRYLIPCNVPKLYWPIADAINHIKEIGGVPVLAHPTSITNDRTQLTNIVQELAKAGLEGIEVYNNMAQPEEMEFLRRRAAENNLLTTAGSDFHGIEQGLEIGRGRNGIRFSSKLLDTLKLKISINQTNYNKIKTIRSNR